MAIVSVFADTRDDDMLRILAILGGVLVVGVAVATILLTFTKKTTTKGKFDFREDDSSPGRPPAIGAASVTSKPGKVREDVAQPRQSAPVTVRLFFQGKLKSPRGSPRIAVYFDEKFVGNGTLIEGFDFEVLTTPGEHKAKVKFAIKDAKTYNLDCSRPGKYEVKPYWSIKGGNFSNECDISYTPNKVKNPIPRVEPQEEGDEA